MNYLKNLSTQPVPAFSYPTCSAHNRPLVYMCFAKSCAAKLLCEYCVSQNHKFHENDIQAISDFLAGIPYQRKSSDFGLMSQIKSMLNAKNKIINDMNNSLTEAENKILDHFDDLKKDLNLMLDLAYRQFCQDNRDINTKYLNKLENKMKKMGVIMKIQEIMLNKATVDVHSQEELQNIAKYIAKNGNKLNQLADVLKTKQKEVDTVISDHNYYVSQFDEPKFQAAATSISNFVKKAFAIKESSFPEFHSDLPYDTKATPTPETPQGGYAGHEGDIYTVSILNKQLIATAGEDRVIKLWNLQTGECTGELHGHKDAIWSLLSAYEGKYIVSGSEDKTVKVWKIAERKCTKTFAAHNGPVLCLEYLKVQKILTSGSGDGVIVLWDMQQGKAAGSFNAHKKAIWVIRGIKNENIITAGGDCLIKIWDPRKGVCLQTLQGHKGTVYGVLCFNNEKNLITCSDDETLRVWELEEGVCVQIIKGHEKGVRSLGINLGESLVATGGIDHCLKIWDLKSLKLLKIQEKNDSVITSVQFYDEFSVLYADRNPKFFKLNVI